MKKMLTLVVFTMIVVATQAQTLQSLFEKYSEDERFTYVTVGSGMMNLASNFGIKNKNSKEMVSKMKSIKILTLEHEANSVIMKSVVQELDKVIEAGKFETAVEAREKGEMVHIYYRLTGKDNADMLIVTKDKGKLSLVWISGKMSKEEMMNSFSQNGKARNEEATS
jgi:hypothetical protein